MDEETKIKELIAEGEYFQALGLHPQSTRLEIDTTSARLSQAYPGLAGVLSGITQVITDSYKKEIYRIACEFRDTVMQSLIKRFGNDFLKEFIPSCRSVIWSECQSLLRCDFKNADVKIGPNGAKSLANRGLDWIVESVVNNCLCVIERSANEKHSGRVSRIISKVNCPKCGNSRQLRCAKCEGTGRITTSADVVSIPVLTDDFVQIERDFTTTACPDCRGSGTVPCDCQDIYTFQIPHGTAPGSVIMGRGERTKKIYYAILDSKVVSPRPMRVLWYVYMGYNLKQSFPSLGEEADFTLEYAESMLNYSLKVALVVWLLFGTMVGKFLGSWQTGVVIAILATLGFAILQRYMFPPKIHTIVKWLILIVLPILGAFVGHFLTSWRSGVTISGIMSGVLLAFYLIYNAIDRKLR